MSYRSGYPRPEEYDTFEEYDEAVKLWEWDDDARVDEYIERRQWERSL